MPLVFLDVDGTLIPFKARRFGGVVAETGNPLLDRLDPEDGRRLLALGGQLVWATTWMADANEVIAPRLGLPMLPVVEWPDEDEDEDERRLEDEREREYRRWDGRECRLEDERERWHGRREDGEGGPERRHGDERWDEGERGHERRHEGDHGRGRGGSGGGLHWKTVALTRYARGRPFVWLDDEITDADLGWVREHYSGPALLHRVDPLTGLTAADFSVVRRWVNARPSRRPA